MSVIHFFLRVSFNIGVVCNYEASIKLAEDRYVANKPWVRTSISRRLRVKCELVQHGIIRESFSPFSAPLMMQFKKTGEERDEERTWRCIDYRELNLIVVSESQPFPLIKDIIAKTRYHSWFTTLDIKSAFWIVSKMDSNRSNTCFVTQSGHYEWCRTPSGLKRLLQYFNGFFPGLYVGISS